MKKIEKHHFENMPEAPWIAILLVYGSMLTALLNFNVISLTLNSLITALVIYSIIKYRKSQTLITVSIGAFLAMLCSLPIIMF